MSDTREAEAKKLRETMTLREIGKKFGVSNSTILRWTNPESLAVSRQTSRMAKLRRTGICERCGGETRYNGSTTNGPSKVCEKCVHTFTHCSRGHRYTPKTRLDGKTQGWTCRICRNAYAREASRLKRRAAGIPEIGSYTRPIEEMLFAAISEEPPTVEA